MRIRNVIDHINTKQDIISDLATIRAGAEAGASAVQPAAISDMATQTWVGQQGFAAETDLGSNLFTVADGFTVDMQHCYQIGPLVFIHIVFHKNAAPSAASILKIGTFSIHPQHDHAFPATAYNASASTTSKKLLDSRGVLETNGDIWCYFISDSTSNAIYDIEFFFCANDNDQDGSNIFDIGQAVDITINYNANGGEGTMESTIAISPTAAACTFTAPSGMQFVEWNTAADGSGDTYAVGDSIEADLTLYAIWEEASV